MDPNEDEISQVLDFLDLDRLQDRGLVIQALKSNRRDVQTVASQYFDDPISFRSKYSAAWDEGMFSGDRDNSNNNAGISFHIESSDQNEVIQGVDPHMDGSAPGAPSRPPSRTNSKSPLGKVVDWAAPDVHGHGGPSSQAQEDEDIQRAIRESAQEAGVQIPAQESGVIDSTTSQPHFGPANRESYEQGNWAMVPTGGHETKLQASCTASERKRMPDGAPAFMVQGYSSHGQHNLGGLLTILHEIPLARNVLLSLGEHQATYGYNREWWNGQEILPEHVLAKLASGEMQWGEQNESLPNLETEIHRIMAFLDGTERGYGTISVLADMIAAGRGAEKQFYEAIAVRNHDKIEVLSHKAILTEVQGDTVEEESVADFGLLEMEHPRTDYSTIKTLYESMDHVMWNDALNWNEIHEGSKMAMFSKTGETFVLKVSGDGPETSFDFPLEFYPEKYLSDRKSEAVRIQTAWVETKLQAERLRQAEQTLTMWRDDWNNKTYDKKDLVQKAMAQWKTYREYLEGLGQLRSMEESGFDTDKYPVYSMAPVQLNDKEEALVGKVDEAVRVAEKLLTDIENRLQWLRSQSELVEARQRFVGSLLTDPNKERPQPMSCKRYLLRGVATSLDVTYVCKRSEPDLIDLEDSGQSLDQWWRLARAPDQSQLVEKVEVERVLRDMWQETKTPLVVYATEEALSTPRDPLSGPLERFVKADNKAFRQELSQEETRDDQTFSTADVISPTKRKHRSDSIDSMASNRASLGSIEMEDREDPFVDRADAPVPDLLGQEMEERQSHHTEGGEGTGADAGALKGIQQSTPGVGDSSMIATDHADEADSSTTNGTGIPTPSTSTQTDGFSRTMSPDADVAKSPEMQERSRPSLFMAANTNDGDKSAQVDTMKMEVPEHHE